MKDKVEMRELMILLTTIHETYALLLFDWATEWDIECYSRAPRYQTGVDSAPGSQAAP